MTTLERTLVEKAGYDKGWEVVIERVPDRVVLASALHRSRDTVAGTLAEGETGDPRGCPGPLPGRGGTVALALVHPVWKTAGFPLG